MYFLQESEEIKDLIEDLTRVDILWLDTETADYTTSKPRISLIQVLVDRDDLIGARTCLLDVLEQPELVDIFIKKIMQNEAIEKIFHNANYDLRFLGKDSAKNVTCTWEIAKKIPYHVLPLKSLSLKSLAENLAGFKEVNKEEQCSDWGQRPLTEKQLFYAAMDPVYLAQVHRHLLQLREKAPPPDPKTDNLTVLSQRYLAIEKDWKKLDAEMEEIRERIKKAMQVQNIAETELFQLSITERNTIKTQFTELVDLVVNEGKKIDFDLTLTKEIQEQLGHLLEKLNVTIKTTSVVSLKVKTKE